MDGRRLQVKMIGIEFDLMLLKYSVPFMVLFWGIYLPLKMNDKGELTKQGKCKMKGFWKELFKLKKDNQKRNNQQNLIRKNK